jgi:hypothetical protein
MRAKPLSALPESVNEAKLLARLLSRVDMPTGCWQWTGADDGNGYGTIDVEGTPRKTHRVAYLLFRGTIPEGMEPDHLCRNRRCINPWHLELVTKRENILRGEGLAAKNARKTHCKHGHLLQGDDVYTNPITGKRACRVCGRGHEKAYKASLALAGPQ